MKPIPYGKQNITEEDIQSVIEVLRSDYLTQGPKIFEFESAFAKHIGCKYAVAVANGTAALHLSAMALNINSSQRVITTPITFAASANCVRFCNGNVVFSDIDPTTYLLDLKKVTKLLESEPIGSFSGIIVVDFAGRAVNIEALRELADKYGLWIIEDACHALGGYFIDSNGFNQKCGNGKFADLTIFSFHPVKHIATGEGGMITTNDVSLYKRLLLTRTHGITKNFDIFDENHGNWYYEMQELGYNYRLTDIHASLGISQLKRADTSLKRRKEIAATYYQAFNNKTFIKGQSGLIQGHAYHLYIIEVYDRKGLYDYLHKNNILVQIHYIPLHLMPYYRQFGWEKGDFPNSEKYYAHCISLPMYPTLSDEEQSYVIAKIIAYYES